MTTEEAPPARKPAGTTAWKIGLALSAGLYALLRFVLLADDPLTPQSHWLGLKVSGWPEDLQGYLFPFDVCLTALGVLVTYRAAFRWRKRIKAAPVKILVRLLLYICLAFGFGFGVSCMLLPGIFGWLTTLELALYAGVLVWGLLIALLAIAVGLYCLGRLVILISEGIRWILRRKRITAATHANTAKLEAIRSKRSLSGKASKRGDPADNE